jgi:hypothetical protein
LHLFPRRKEVKVAKSQYEKRSPRQFLWLRDKAAPTADLPRPEVPFSAALLTQTGQKAAHQFRAYVMMQTQRTNRRSMLQGMGYAGLAALLAPGISLVRSERAKAAREPLIQPLEIRSRNGVLDATITAASGRLQLGETELPGFFYNGSYLPPLLRVRLGDGIRIRFKNELLDGFSNLHYHGMNVSPRGRSDNVFIHVLPGHEFNYEVMVPTAGRQGPGMFWYHPHGHGFVTKQMLGGMSGGLVVHGSETLFPILHGLPERFFLIKHAEPGNNREIITINGQLNPVIDIRPGEMQFWRIANIGATLFFPLQIQGMPLYVIATDGHPLSQPRKINETLLGPGSADRRDRYRSAGWRIPGSNTIVQEHGLAGPVSGPANRNHCVRWFSGFREC